MKEWISRLTLIGADLLLLPVVLGLALQLWPLLISADSSAYSWETHLHLLPLYLIIPVLFLLQGLYHRRYDFWHESRLIFRSLFLALILLTSFLALNHTVQSYSRGVILLSFLLLALLTPLVKRQLKFTLYRLGYWKKAVHLYGEDPFLKEEIYANPYLGYNHKEKDQEAGTLLINASRMEPRQVERLLEEKFSTHREVLFIPMLNDFDLTHSRIYELSNIQSNLIHLENRLRNPLLFRLKRSLDFTGALLLLPLILPVIGIVAFMIRYREPESPVFFLQPRIGKGGKLFTCYKFRTMVPEGDELLERHLKKHPEERLHYQKYRKYINDPRITELGAFLRRFSLDELPQIINVLRGEMSLVGPRPYLPEEVPLMGKAREFILAVPPGITGLWQVSGRNRLDFDRRLHLDQWYVRNWNLWLDLTILAKTLKVLYSREGAS